MVKYAVEKNWEKPSDENRLVLTILKTRPELIDYFYNVKTGKGQKVFKNPESIHNYLSAIIEKTYYTTGFKTSTPVELLKEPYFQQILIESESPAKAVNTYYKYSMPRVK